MPNQTLPRPNPSGFRRPFLRGLAALLPTILTIFVIVFVYNLISNRLVLPIRNAIVGYLISSYAGPDATQVSFPALHITLKLDPANQLDPTNWTVKLIGVAIFLITVVLIYFLGFFATSYVGRKMWGRFEHVWTTFPFVKQIYPYARQITDFVLSEKQRKFTRVVAVEYPRKGLYSLGFITSDGIRAINRASGKRMINVFIPSSPTPFTGYVVCVPHDELIPLSISVDQAIRFTVSGGVIVPMDQEVGEETRQFLGTQLSRQIEEQNAGPDKAQLDSPQDEKKEG